MRRLPLSRPGLAVLAQMLAAYAAWFALYDLWLLPDGRLDALVARNGAALAGLLLGSVGVEAFVSDRVVWTSADTGVLVADGCTGLAVVGLFAGFVLAFPGSWRRRALFLPLGALAVHLVNVARIALLAWLHRAQPALFDAAHHWGTPPFFYAAVFVLWVAWVHLGAERPAPAAAR